MSHIMKALGVKNSEAWAALAWERPEDQNEQACIDRRNASGQMLAMLTSLGFMPDESFLADTELLITGRMSYDEHRAYLLEKYKEQA